MGGTGDSIEKRVRAGQKGLDSEPRGATPSFDDDCIARREPDTLHGLALFTRTSDKPETSDSRLLRHKPILTCMCDVHRPSGCA